MSKPGSRGQSSFVSSGSNRPKAPVASNPRPTPALLTKRAVEPVRKHACLPTASISQRRRSSRTTLKPGACAPAGILNRGMPCVPVGRYLLIALARYPRVGDCPDPGWPCPNIGRNCRQRFFFSCERCARGRHVTCGYRSMDQFGAIRSPSLCSTRGPSIASISASRCNNRARSARSSSRFSEELIG